MCHSAASVLLMLALTSEEFVFCAIIPSTVIIFKPKHEQTFASNCVLACRANFKSKQRFCNPLVKPCQDFLKYAS